MKKWKVYVLNILIPLAVGGLSAYITMQGMEDFNSVSKSALNPPDYVFPIVWSILYVLMGFGMARVYLSHCPTDQKSYSVIIYGLQLAFNFCWSIIFFNMKSYLFAFIWLIILIALVIIMIYSWQKCSKLAAYLQVPYLLWLFFASYLTFCVYSLN